MTRHPPSAGHDVRDQAGRFRSRPATQAASRVPDAGPAEAGASDIKLLGAAWLPAGHPATHVTREQLIAEAAYHHAEARGFVPGHELDDWLQAESEVDARLQGEGRAS